GIVNGIQIIGSEDIRRDDVNDVTEGTQQNAVFDEEAVQARAKPGKVTRIVGSKLDRSDCSKHTHIGYTRMISKLSQAFSMDALNCCNAFENRLGFKNLQTGNRCSTAQRISCIRMAVEERARPIHTVENLVDLSPAYRNRERQEP